MGIGSKRLLIEYWKKGIRANNAPEEASGIDHTAMTQGTNMPVEVSANA